MNMPNWCRNFLIVLYGLTAIATSTIGVIVGVGIHDIVHGLILTGIAIIIAQRITS